jgi:hypothetical protein
LVQVYGVNNTGALFILEGRLTRAWSGQPRRVTRWTPPYAERGLPLTRQPLDGAMETLVNLNIPDEIVVSVESDDPGLAPIGDLLVAADFQLDGRYYYGALLGLTDTKGVLRRTREDLLDGFFENQRTFPMDYKVSLEDCDGVVTLRIPGGHSFVEALKTVEDGLVRPEWRQDYLKARNRDINSVAASLDLTTMRHTAQATLRVRHSALNASSGGAI